MLSNTVAPQVTTTKVKIRPIRQFVAQHLVAAKVIGNMLSRADFGASSRSFTDICFYCLEHYLMQEDFKAVLKHDCKNWMKTYHPKLAHGVAM